MYYLFITKEKDIELYKNEFNRVSENMEKGKTPVYSEMRGAKTTLIESFPYQLIAGVMVILGTLLIAQINCNETVKIAIVMIINNFCHAVANYIFTFAKHGLRLKLCKRIGIEPTEKNIAVMESLEYQSV